MLGRKGSLKKGSALRKNKYLKNKLSDGFLAGITPPPAEEKIRQIHSSSWGTVLWRQSSIWLVMLPFLFPHEAISSLKTLITMIIIIVFKVTQDGWKNPVFLRCGLGRTHTEAFHCQGHLKINHTFPKAVMEGVGLSHPAKIETEVPCRGDIIPFVWVWELNFNII